MFRAIKNFIKRWKDVIFPPKVEYTPEAVSTDYYPQEVEIPVGETSNTVATTLGEWKDFDPVDSVVKEDEPEVELPSDVEPKSYGGCTVEGTDVAVDVDDDDRTVYFIDVGDMSTEEVKALIDESVANVKAENPDLVVDVKENDEKLVIETSYVEAPAPVTTEAEYTLQVEPTELLVDESLADEGVFIAPEVPVVEEAPVEEETKAEDKPKKKRRGSRGRKKKAKSTDA